MANLWSGRFSGEPDKDVFAFGRSFPFDKRLVEDDITGSLAWAAAIHAAGVLSADEHARISSGLTDLLARVRENPAIVEGDDEDVHAWVERILIDRVGEMGKRLHTGRSRNEQVSVDLRLYLRRRSPCCRPSSSGSWPRSSSRRARGRDADAGLYAPSPRTTGARCALLAVARRRVPPRLHAPLAGDCRSGRDAARLRRDRGKFI